MNIDRAPSSGSTPIESDEEMGRIWRALAGVSARPDFRFDRDFYKGHYPDMAGPNADCHAHYTNHGAREGRFPNRYKATRAAKPANFAEALTKLVVDADLRSLIDAGHADALELAHELICLGEPVDRRVSNFSSRHYLSTYKDVARANIDPVSHYFKHGHAEGRVTLANLRDGIYTGRIAYDPDKPTCLICAHEFSRSGAPAVALDIAREASAGHNVIVMALRAGEHLAAFRHTSCTVIISSAPLEDWPYFGVEGLDQLDFAVLNSVEAFPFIKPLVAMDVRIVSYIHEFAEYVLPAYKAAITAMFADLIVFSSVVVRDSWRGVLIDAGVDIEQHVKLLPQASLVFAPVEPGRFKEARERLSSALGVDCSKRRIVYSAGHIQIRKGTDLFVLTAQLVRELDPDTLFVWIGDGANHEDVSFGVWLDNHLREAGAGSREGNLFVLPAGSLYHDVCAAADVLYLPSRLDPLPNVVFDAAQHGCSTVVFRGATGFDDPCYDVERSLVRVRYGDIGAAAREVLRVPRKLSGQRYLDLVNTISAPAAPVAMFEQMRAMVASLPQVEPMSPTPGIYNVSVLFRDQEAGRSDLRLAERKRLSDLGRRAIWVDVNAARRAMATEGGWMHAGSRIEPYYDIPVGDPALADLPPLLVHIHAHYLDGLERDLAGLAAYRLAAEVIATTDTDAKAARIEAFGKAAGIAIEARVITNQGRDILPFLRVVHQHPAGDDAIWCHVHQKKSLTSTIGGDAWREFLIRILLGDSVNVASAVERIAQPGAGLVTAFDPYVVGWAGSRRLLPEIEQRLGQCLPAHPLLFPIGNMFWTRAGVVRRMMGLFGPDYPWPNEPLPNDGTVYHLIERLWPVMAVGSGCETVFIDRPDTKRV